jgi:hypothetical protein
MREYKRHYNNTDIISPVFLLMLLLVSVVWLLHLFFRLRRYTILIMSVTNLSTQFNPIQSNLRTDNYSFKLLSLLFPPFQFITIFNLIK